MGRLKLFLPLLIFAVLAVFLMRGLSIDPTELPSPLTGKPFPEFQLTDLSDPSRTLTAADIRGKVALVNVWATWCPTCRAEHAQLLAIAAAGTPVVGINYKDERGDAQAWLEELGNPYQFNIFDPEGRLGLDLGVYGAPETYLVDRRGIIRYKRVGAVDATVWLQEIKPLVDQLESEP
jgi:cytochrome c biogenesis protein CcmG, thiol:disulfide interchange protein DsbE